MTIFSNATFHSALRDGLVSPLLPDGAPKSPSKTKLATINILGGMVYGYCTAIVAGATPAIEGDWGKLSSVMSGLITASIIFGAGIGSLTGGVLADRIGRQKSAIIMSVVSLVFSLAEAASPNKPVLLITRVFLGYALGLITVVCPLYVGEAAPKENRGFLNAFFQVSITLGIVFAYLAGYVFQPSWTGSALLSWRLMFCLGGFFSIVLLYVSLFSMEESPLWLQQQQDAKLRPLAQAVDPTLSFSNPFSQSEVTGWRGLFSKASLLPLSIGIVLAFDLQATGINGIVFYLPSLLQQAGLGDMAQVLTIAVGVFNFASTIFALVLVDRAGRKPLLLLGTAIMGISLLLIGFAFFFMHGLVRGWFAFGAILIFHLGFEVGPGSLFWIIISEIFPTGVRSEANGFINLINNALNLLVCLVFPAAFASAGGYVFFFFAVMAALAWAYAFFAYHESKDNSPLQSVDSANATLQ